uniref:Ig-like domain-containing protein n=1 Tax=Salarias fasciatus TaxID=181472 RepID=A0A672GFR2_SALFA
MLRSALLLVVFGVLLVSAQSDKITVCLEDDNDLRVDCLIKPKPNQIDSYEFSWASGNKEVLINTNVSGSSADNQFKEKSYVEELKPHGYRMTLKGFTDTLPHNTTYLCKISGSGASENVEKNKLVPCSAVSVLLRTSWSWILCVILFFYHTRN